MIRNRIKEYRARFDMKQEELAQLVGVSSAAVSKWETASALPDVALLCPLARALGCRVDELLQFTPAMTEAEAVEHLNGILHTALTGDRFGAEAALTALLREYPGCAALQMQAAVGWAAFRVFFPDADQADKDRWQDNAAALWAELHAGPDPAMAQYAANQLASCAIARGQLDQAERYLQELPDHVVDATNNRYLLQLKRGETDAARATLQNQLYKHVHHVCSLLALLQSETLLPEPERRLAVAEAAGFDNLSHFNRQFKRRYGMTPSAYRRAPAAGQQKAPDPAGSGAVQKAGISRGLPAGDSRGSS